MAKIMLVEDDKSLREIYGVRLLAEGYDIVSAGDGEEALAMAIKERPNLIISDVMMPKISGFDMLDILRSTTETKNIKVIMMTALSSEEQRKRGESLGADRYLVKSQVGIEDVVRVVHEVLGDGIGGTPAATPAPPVVAVPATQSVIPPAVANAQPIPAPISPVASAPPTAMPSTRAQAPQPTGLPIPPSVPAQPVHGSSSPAAPSTRNRVIQPINDPSKTPININELLDKELAKETPPPSPGPAQTPVLPVPPAVTSAPPTPPASPTTPQAPGVSIAPDGQVIPPASGTSTSGPSDQVPPQA